MIKSLLIVFASFLAIVLLVVIWQAIKSTRRYINAKQKFAVQQSIRNYESSYSRIMELLEQADFDPRLSSITALQAARMAVLEREVLLLDTLATLGEPPTLSPNQTRARSRGTQASSTANAYPTSHQALYA